MNRAHELSLLLVSVFGCALAGCAGVRGPSRAVAQVEATAGGGRCVVIQRGRGGAVADTRIAERWPDANYGDQATSCAGKVGAASRETLLRFDLSSVPDGVVITRATVTLHTATAGAARVTAHRATAPWDEHATTWHSFARAYDESPAAEAHTTDEAETLALDVTSLARSWQAGALSNDGLVLRQDSSVTGLVTSESPDVNARPELEVCYY